MYVPKELLYSWKKRHHAVGRRTWYQKSPTYIPKETYIHTKRSTCYAVRKPYVCVYQMRFFIWKKRHRTVGRGVASMKPYVYTKRAINVYQKSPTHIEKEPFTNTLKECCTYIPKEPYTYKKGALHKHERALYMHQKSPIYIPKGPNICTKRAHVHAEKDVFLERDTARHHLVCRGL